MVVCANTLLTYGILIQVLIREVHPFTCNYVPQTNQKCGKKLRLLRTHVTVILKTT